MKKYYHDYALQLFKDGYIPTPLKGKGQGMIPGWSSIRYDEDFVNHLRNEKGGYSIGILCGIGNFPIVAIDIDVYDPIVSNEISNAIITRFGYSPIRIGKKPKQLIVYLSDKEFSKSKISFEDESGVTQSVEVLGKGQQFVAFGIHKDTLRPYEWVGESILDIEAMMLTEINIDELNEWLNDELPKLVPDTWVQTNQSSSITTVGDSDDFTLHVPKPATDFTREQVIDMLSIQSPDCSNDEWIRIGAALKHWDENEGLKIWDEWSRPGKTYIEGETSKRWKSFTPRPNGITLATYWKQYKSFLSSQDNKVSDHMIEKIKKSETKDDLIELAKTIAFVKLDPIVEVTIFDDFKKQFKSITNVSITKTEFKKLLAKIRKTESDTIGSTEVITSPEWMDDWVFVSASDQFFRINSSEWVTTKGFDIKYTREIEPNENGIRKPASRSAAEDFGIPVVESAIYHPAEGTLFEYRGKKCVNLFDINNIPKEAVNISEDGQKACDDIYNHINLLCSKREDVTRQVMDWLAFNVQNMGVKINYSILLQGIEGIGKSFIKEMMHAVLGENSSEVSPQSVIEKFNSWAQNSSFVTFEELRILGHNRYEVVSAIKPLISNKQVNIRKMRHDSYTVPNVTNYMALTNYKDALPLDPTDRRWFIIFAPYLNLKEFEDDINEKAHVYFSRLFNNLEKYAPEIRRWLLDWEFSKDFNPNGRAPITDERDAMIDTASGTDETHLITSIIESGVDGVSIEAISVPHLYRAITERTTVDSMDGIQIHITHAMVSTTLKTMGYVRFMNNKQFRWNGENVRCWVRRPTIKTIDAIKELLDYTLENPFA